MIALNSLVVRIVALLVALAAVAPAMADAQSIADACIARMANQVESGQTLIGNAAENAVLRIETLDAEDARPSKMIAASRTGQRIITKSAERTRQAIRNEARRCVYTLVRQDAEQAIIDSVVDAAQAAQQSVTNTAESAHLMVHDALQAALADESTPV